MLNYAKANGTQQLRNPAIKNWLVGTDSFGMLMPQIDIFDSQTDTIREIDGGVRCRRQ